MGYTDKKYICVCHALYTGENCGQGKRQPENFNIMLFTCLDSRKLSADNVIWLFSILVIELVVVFTIQTIVWSVSCFLEKKVRT